MVYRNIAAVYTIKTSLISFFLFQEFLIHAAVFLPGMFLNISWVDPRLKLFVKYSSPKNKYNWPYIDSILWYIEE